MTGIVTLLATLTAKPGQTERLGEMLRAMVEPSRTEEGCLTYNIHHSNTDQAVWIVYEIWRSKADLDHHMILPPFQAFLAEASEVLANDIDFHFVTLDGPPAFRSA